MKHIYLNLKRFDIPKEEGGVNSIAPVSEWGAYIVERTKDALQNMGRRKQSLSCIFRKRI